MTSVCQNSLRALYHRPRNQAAPPSFFLTTTFHSGRNIPFNAYLLVYLEAIDLGNPDSSSDKRSRMKKRIRELAHPRPNLTGQTMSSPTISSRKPTIVFVPGAFHTPEHFRPMSTLLEASSYQTITVALPSIGARASSASYRDDVHAIRSTLQELVEDEGKDVLLAVHSYGAVPGCQTVGGLEKNARMKEGKKGGVVHVLFMVALLVEQGQRLRDVLEGGLPAWAAFCCFYRAEVCVAEELLPEGQRMTFLYIRKDKKSHANGYKPVAIYM